MSGVPSQPNYPHIVEAQVTPGLFAPRRLLGVVIELLFPPCCVSCGRIDTNLCARCHHELDQIPFTSIADPVPPLTAVASTGVHTDKLRDAIHALKYENSPVLAEALGSRLIARFRLLDWQIDLIVPVPLHAARLSERGYNQAHLLAQQVATHVGIPCTPEALRRERHTHSQVGLNSEERRVNVADAFRSTPSLVLHKNLLLVDDVYTTGATLSACAEAALAAGAYTVYGLTVSSARG